MDRLQEKKCVATSLCSLIDNNIRGISPANDLTQTTNIGYQFYQTLSWLSRQAFLMQWELPTVLNVFDTDYWNIATTLVLHQETAIEGYQYCTFLQRAFESFISENYTNFILTISCIAVATQPKRVPEWRA